MTSNIAPPSRQPPPPPPSTKKRYPHFQDLVARTDSLKVSEHASIRTWLENAQRHWHQARLYKDIGSLDAAYVEYLLAFQIVSSVIPGCREYPTFRAQNSSQRAYYKKLRQELTGRTDEFDKVKNEIKQNNAYYGTLSAAEQLAAAEAARAKPSGNQSNLLNGTQPNGRSNLKSKDPARPEVRAKPEHLQSRTIAPASKPALDSTQSNAPPDASDLQARFEKLKAGRSFLSSGPGSPPPTGGRVVPQGPREMPPKLDVKQAQLQYPAPTYSPATSYASPGGISPPRSSVRNSLLGRAKPQAPLAPTTPPPDVPLPAGPILGPETLFECLKPGSTISILLLDVRDRSEFKNGHIYARSVVCIDPIALREGMSGDDLEDALVISPQGEQEIFAAREKYQMVVYYDQSTKGLNFLVGNLSDRASVALRTLHMALTDYAYRKTLYRQPYILNGGLDAWIDLVGPASLKTIDDEPEAQRSALYRQNATRRAPSPLKLDRDSHGAEPPEPTTTTTGRSYMDGAEIDIEQEKKWLVDVTVAMPTTPKAEDIKKRRTTSIVANSSDSPYARTVEEFFQKYPASPGFQESLALPPSQAPSEQPSLTRKPTIIDHPFHGFADVRHQDVNPPPTRPAPVAPRKSYSGVSERIGSTSQPVPVALSKPLKNGMIQPLPLPRGGSGLGEDRGTTGLKNLGNTCYMNSILQCMSGTVPLRRYFLDGSYKTHINKNNPLGSRGVLAEAFAQVVRNLWSGEFNFISPVTFKDVSGRLNETFKNNDQQDAQEFLEFVLDGLHEDLNTNANRTKLDPLTEEEERRREKLPIWVASNIEWKRYVHQNWSIIVNLLQGQLSSKLRCLTCNITSTTFNPFMYLSLPIPVKNGEFSLYDCLKEFTKEEVLDGDDAWLCPNCKTRRKATKVLTIARLPNILVIHLKRFTNRGRWGDKLNTFVNFPLSDLDLTRYVPPPEPGENGEWEKETEKQREKVGENFVYDCYGIANHYGTLHGGHYTAFVKNPHIGVWHTFDDSKATKMSEEQVVSRGAYVLFWVRAGSM